MGVPRYVACPSIGKSCTRDCRFGIGGGHTVRRRSGGIPTGTSRVSSYGQDISTENLPQEVDRDQHAISFTKGCYLGQETVARIDALGHVNRLLKSLSWDDASELPPVAMPLQCEGKTVGQVTSVCWGSAAGKAVGLGYVRREHSSEGTELDTDLGPARVIPRRRHAS